MGAKKRTIYHEVIKSQEQYEDLCAVSEPAGGRIAIIDCHLDWCGPCVPMVPNYQTLINTYDDADNRFAFFQFPECNMSDEFKEKMNLDIIPRYILIAGGHIAAEIKGAKYVELVDALNKFIPELNED